MAKRKSSTKISNRTHVFDAFHEEKICEIPITLAKYVDPMDRLRPKKNRAKEYNLDQKYALMDKGDVKVRYTDTDATYVWNPEGYVPPPPPKLERKERGRGPLEELLDETWRKVVDKQQMRIRAQNRIKFATTKRTKLRKFLIAQQSILEDTGPDWFQEMKTEQLEVVESLAGCIHYDLQRKSICKTLEAMARLGLVPRPRPVNIKIALDSCCASPVEFLLILYHISNAKRASYSINDRLLLSAVVHLTIKDTFKELHVRIPSPPPVPKVPLKPRTPPQRIPCRSPYLDTFIHQPPMPKRNWEKPDREYPRSEFFSYLDELKKNTVMLSADSGCFVSTKEDTINVEDVMNDDMDGPRNYLVRMEKELAKEWMLAQKVYNKMAKTQLVPALHKCTVHFPCFSGITEIERAPTIYIDDYDEEESEEVPTTTESATCQPCPALLLEEDEAVDVCEAPLVEEQEEQPPVPVKMRLNPVTCQDEVDEDPVAEPDEPYSYKVGKTLEVKKTPSTECRCKEMILKRVEETTCKCEECQEALRLANLKQTFIITDTQEIEGEKPVRIVGGVKSEKLCTCLEKYQARWEKYEKRVEVKKAQQDLKSLEAKFIITGTAVGPDGKLVYILEGVQTEKKCECYKIPKYEEEEKKQLALMPKIPEGCIKYVISGVQARPDGNVYILSGVTQNDDCQCLEYLEKFCENHSFCMYLYQEYLKKIAFDTQEYFKEMPSMYTSFTPEAKSDVVEEEEDEVCPCVCVCDKSPIKCEFYTGPFEEEQAQQQEEEDVCSGYGNSKFEHVSSVGSECRCDDAWDYSSYVCEEEEGVKLERYIILEKFPRKPKDQLELLKGALDKLAEDGFPLAKLPDAYRLPHFGLWLQMRSKKYWTKEERISLYHGSKKPWKYVESNKTHVHIPIETFLRNEKHKQNWSYCKLIKNTGDAMRQKLYRSLKARSIKYARELYPTMYAYEFPTKAFRDVFFAYLPAKEESATPMYLWQQFELIDYARLRNWSKMR